MTKLILHSVMRNEEGRFLRRWLEWHTPLFDIVHVFDDISTDNTVEIIKNYTPFVTVRKDTQTSFLENEGEFRQAAWDNMEAMCSPDKNTFILCLDADEFLVANNGIEKDALRALVDHCIGSKKMSARIQIPELWELNPPKVRVDGWWNKNKLVRLVRWQRGGVFPQYRLGCGSAPSYALKDPMYGVSLVNILHLGYTVKGAIEKKYELYKNQEGNMHDSAHVRTIVSTPKLIDYKGRMPNL